jgi:curli biogenesis system outer membrane secretion channel CsgG
MEDRMRVTRLIAAILLAAYLPACATYSVMPDPASTLKAPQTEFKQVRVTLRSGESFEIRSPQVDGDSLRGQLPPGVWSGALADIRSVEIRRTDGAKTAAFTAAVIIAVAIVWKAVNVDYWLAGAP